MIQEAYHSKVKGKSTVTSNNDQIDFIGLLTNPISSTSMITTTTVQTPQTEHVIHAQDIQLEKIFPQQTSQIESENVTTFLNSTDDITTSTYNIINDQTTQNFIEETNQTTESDLNDSFYPLDETTTITVYRGQGLSVMELDKLKNT